MGGSKPKSSGRRNGSLKSDSSGAFLYSFTQLFNFPEKRLLISFAETQILTNFLEECRYKPRKTRQGRLWRTILNSSACCLLFIYFFEGFSQVFFTGFLKLTQLMIGFYGNPLERFRVCQALHDDLVSYVVDHSLKELITHPAEG